MGLFLICLEGRMRAAGLGKLWALLWRGHRPSIPVEVIP